MPSSHNDLAGPETCPVCGRPGNCCAKRDRYRVALERIADYGEAPHRNPPSEATMRRVAREALDA